MTTKRNDARVVGDSASVTSATVQSKSSLRPRTYQKRNLTNPSHHQHDGSKGDVVVVESKSSFTNQSKNQYNNMPPPIYHRHYRQDQPPFMRSSSSRKQRSSRIVLFFPMLLFGTILGVVFLQPLPPNHEVTFRHSSQSAKAAMLSVSRRSKMKIMQPRNETIVAVASDSSNEPHNPQRRQAEALVDHTKTPIVKPRLNQHITKANSTHQQINHRINEVFVIALKQGGEVTSTTDQKHKRILTLFLQDHLSPTKTSLNKNQRKRTSLLSRTFQTKSSTDSVIKNKNNESDCDNHHPSLFLPIDDFPDEDPFLPWIHDYWHVHDTTNGQHAGKIQFVAQNKRRCETGDGKDKKMKHWEPQVALFQSIPIVVSKDNTTLRIADSLQTATIPETRILCHYHSTSSSSSSLITFSSFNFNYEYVLWRKREEHYKGMFVEKGKDVHQFELSQLMFSCPVPSAVVDQEGGGGRDQWYLDLIPIRTEVRRGQERLLWPDQVGPEEFMALSQQQQEHRSISTGSSPMKINDMIQTWGRWANIPLCLRTPDSAGRAEEKSNNHFTPIANGKEHNFVLCTWTAANYFRRGDATSIADSERRLREWITFHRLVGVDHVYVYDNSQPSSNSNNSKSTFVSPLKILVERYFSADFVTYMPWPCQVCSNNRPNHANPGERSSQYGAEASCRERFGPSTEWMAFIDIDEYLVPMMPIRSKTNSTKTKRVTSWKPILERKREEGYHVLKMRSSRGRPRLSLLETIVNDTENVCERSRKSSFPKELCVQPPESQTYLRVYNCEYIRPPKPERFQRAMKQIYRPEFVLSHYVHYATITKPMTEYYGERLRHNNSNTSEIQYSRALQQWEWGDVFLDDLKEGVLVHTKSVLPHETMYRSSECKHASKFVCPVGLECPDSTVFVDKLHTKNLFQDEDGHYCNCWINHHLEDMLIPRLEAELKDW